MAQKQKTVQLTLLDVTQEEEEREPIGIMKTKHFEIRSTQSQVDSFLGKVNKMKKTVPVYTEEQKKALKRLWVQKKMRSINEENITGEEYYLSKRSLLKQIFGDVLE